jgi:hypothetical protein
MNTNYYEKYLKDKAKYLELQKQLGGVPFNIECTQLDKKYKQCTKITSDFNYESFQLEEKEIDQSNKVYELYGLKKSERKILASSDINNKKIKYNIISVQRIYDKININIKQKDNNQNFKIIFTSDTDTITRIFTSDSNTRTQPTQKCLQDITFPEGTTKVTTSTGTAFVTNEQGQQFAVPFANDSPENTYSTASVVGRNASKESVYATLGNV